MDMWPQHENLAPPVAEDPEVSTPDGPEYAGPLQYNPRHMAPSRPITVDSKHHQEVEYYNVEVEQWQPGIVHIQSNRRNTNQYITI